MSNACIRRNLAYPESWNIQNPSMIASRPYSEPSYLCVILSFNIYSLTSRMTSLYVLHYTYSKPCLLSNTQIYSTIFTPYSDVFRHTVTYLELCATVAYSEPFHTYNPYIFRTRDIFITPSRPYSEFLHISDSRHIHNNVFIDTFRNVQAYSIMIVLITLTFFFWL